MQHLRTAMAFPEFCEQFFMDLWHCLSCVQGLGRGFFIIILFYHSSVCSQEHETSACIEMNIGTCETHVFVIS